MFRKTRINPEIINNVDAIEINDSYWAIFSVPPKDVREINSIP
jgi:hypothetical protein